MGLWKVLSEWLGSKKVEVKILCVGLDNSGKSTILNHFKAAKDRRLDVVPTLGFQLETFEQCNIKFVAFDMSGQGRYRDMWETHFAQSDGIIFVIDSSDELRIPVAKEELYHILQHPDIKSNSQLPFLFFANKSDLRLSLPALKCAQLLGLNGDEWEGNDLTNRSSCLRPWYICSSNAQSGEGLDDGIRWLSDKLIKKGVRRKMHDYPTNTAIK